MMMKPSPISYPFSRLLQVRDARAEPGPYPIDLLIDCLLVGLPKLECKFPLSFISHPCPLPSPRAPSFALPLCSPPLLSPSFCPLSPATPNSSSSRAFLLSVVSLFVSGPLHSTPHSSCLAKGAIPSHQSYNPRAPRLTQTRFSGPGLSGSGSGRPR
jgi:hypothetical protein